MSFTAQQTFAAGAGPVAVADLNGDGKPDLVVVNNSGAGSVSVLLNTTAPGATTPSFTTQQTFAVGFEPDSVAVADLNGDGKPDLIVANDSSVSDSVSVFLNTTTAGATIASFTAQQTFATGFNPESVIAADLNGDGKPDLVVANNAGKDVSVLLNTTAPGATTASFTAQQTFAVGGNPNSVAGADLNGDGKPDLIVANGGDNTVSVLMNTTTSGATTASFAPQRTFAAGRAPFDLNVADLNGDGKPDVTVANFIRFGSGYYQSVYNSVSVLLNTTTPGATTPSFAAQGAFFTSPGLQSVSVANVNGDGKPDLVATYGTSYGGTASAAVLLNTTAPGATTTSFVLQQTSAVGNRPTSATVADLNGDGTPDLIVANQGSYYNYSYSPSPVSVLLNPAESFTISGSPATGTIQQDVDNPSSVTPASGTTPQTATPSSAFATNLAVLVENSSGQPAQGVSVTFTAPASGASGKFANNSATVIETTNANGIATASAFTANATTGGYTVTATATGGSSPLANFSLTNATPPTVTTPSTASITSTTATLGGNVTANGGVNLTKRGVLYALTTTNATHNSTAPESPNSTTPPRRSACSPRTPRAFPSAPATPFVAFATNSIGTTYTTPVSTFTTPTPFVVSGSTLTVTGTPEADQFSIIVGASGLTAALNGYSQSYSTPPITTVIFNGDGGADVTTIVAEQGPITATFNLNQTTVTGSNYTYQINNSPSVYIFGALGDTATMNDTAGDDLFTGLPAYSVMQNATTNPTTYWHAAIGFSTVNAVATTGTDTRRSVRLVRQRHLHLQQHRQPDGRHRLPGPCGRLRDGLWPFQQRHRHSQHRADLRHEHLRLRHLGRHSQPLRLRRQRHLHRRAGVQLQHLARVRLLQRGDRFRHRQRHVEQRRHGHGQFLRRGRHQYLQLDWQHEHAHLGRPS